MLTMNLCEDAKRLKELCVETNTQLTNTTAALIAHEGDTELGACLFTFSPKHVTIESITDGADLFLTDGLIRAAINCCSFKGIETFSISDRIHWEMAKNLRIDSDLTNLSINIEDFFTKYKNCGS